MRQAWLAGGLLALVAAIALTACDEAAPTSSEEDEIPGNGGDGQTVDPGDIGPADPPYTASVVYPSGLRLDNLVRDSELSETYPDPGSNQFPFDGGKASHYGAVGYFIDIPSLSQAQRREKVATNFSLEEYVQIPERNGDRHVYVDAQASRHVQDLRNAWGGPLSMSSTYRSPEYNDAIGASFYSRHQYGDAMDIRAPSQQTAQDLYNLAVFLEVDYLEPADLTIAGKNSPWIHIDDRGWPVNTPDSR